MGYANESGYTPETIQDIMTYLMNGINAQFSTTYTYESFQGTNFYKYYYAQAQMLQRNGIKMSEIFLKLQQYFRITNERINRPVVTGPGIIELFQRNGYKASLKKLEEIDAGKLFICVDADDGSHAQGSVEITDYENLVSGTEDTIKIGDTTFTAQAGAATPGDATFQAATSDEATAQSLADQINAHPDASLEVYARAIGEFVYLTAVHGGLAGDEIDLVYTDNDTNVGAVVVEFAGGEDNEDYPDTRLFLCNLVKTCCVGGVISQGTEVETIVLSNGQAFDYKYFLPNRINVKLKLTLTISENNQVVIDSPEMVREKLIENINAMYGLGKNFEPERYFGVNDAPWAADVLLEWSDDGVDTYQDTIFPASFRDLFTFGLEDIDVIEV